MASIFHALNNGYTGLTSTQTGINTVGHNIANAETEGYTRQRVSLASNIPLEEHGQQLGGGAHVDEIARIHDEYVFKRLKGADQNHEFSQFSRKTLEEISTYFPEIDNVGIKYNLHKYMDAWSAVAQDFDSVAQKTILAQEAIHLADSIKDVRDKLSEVQMSLNDQLNVHIEEINRKAEEIARINVKITTSEALTQNHANDLRDKRDKLESDISKLVDTTVSKFNISSDMSRSRDSYDFTTDYNLSIAGYSIVDGKSFHGLKVTNEDNKNELYSVYYERQDGHLFEMTQDINSGKVGALLDLRGDKIDTKTAFLSNGKLQQFINHLDTVAQGLITYTNNIYAQSATEQMTSNTLELPDKYPLTQAVDLGIKSGTFDVVLYDVKGNEAGRRKVKIDPLTSMAFGDQSIVGQLKANKDDNANNNEIDDFDDLFDTHYIEGVLHIAPNAKGKNEGYRIAIEDNGTSFAGAIGLHRFFDGKDAKDITLNTTLTQNASLIQAYGRADEGNNDVANALLQMQYERLEFDNHGIISVDTLSNYFDALTVDVAQSAFIAISKDETNEVQLAAIQREFDAISKVSVDEELTNLIKFQTAYSANAKVITTVDQMIQTLLGIKQ